MGGADLKPVVKLYIWALKQLLEGKKSTPNQVCYAELGYPALPDMIKLKQHKLSSKTVVLNPRGKRGESLGYATGLKILGF